MTISLQEITIVAPLINSIEYDANLTITSFSAILLSDRDNLYMVDSCQK